MSILTTNKEGHYRLRIDSSKYLADNMVSTDNRDVNCFVEIKYTNKHGKDQNLCYNFKKQLTIRFNQLLYASIKNITDLK